MSKAVKQIPLSNFMAERLGAIDPANFPDEAFELYSIPAYDSRCPDVTDGAAIGSTKQIVKPGDVLLSKIVPHIRRSWVVGPANEYRQIASSEWIVFRGDTIEPRYLRHILLTDRFHKQFMATVAGVGGSLLRARPKEVARIPVPLPSLEEQRRIAAILDAADDLRAKRRAAVAKLDTLAQSIFIEMFGDPLINPKGFPVTELGSLIAVGPQNGLYKPSSAYGQGVPILRIDAFYDGRITNLADLKRLAVSENERQLYGLHEGDIVINRVNSTEYLGKSAIIPALPEAVVFESNMMRFRIDATRLSPGYLIEFLQTPFIKSQIRTKTKDAVNQSSINQQDVKSFKVNVPPLSLQQEFVYAIVKLDALKASHQASLDRLNTLFASLQHRAFRGEL